MPVPERPVVVGGSVAGAVAALSLAKAGVETVVLERRAAPLAKVCGEGIHPAGHAVLERLLAPPAAPGVPLRGLTFHVPGAPPLPWRFPAGHTGLGCDRLELDRRLRRALEGSPLVDFRPGVPVNRVTKEPSQWILETPAGVLACSELIAADGVRSQLRAVAGLARGRERGRWGARLRLETEHGLEHVAVHFRRAREIYITPIAAERISVAVLGGERDVRDLRETAAFLEFVRAAVPDGGFRPESTPEILPHRGERARAFARDGLVLAGDAAFCIDPVAGAGMTVAALTGELAAAAVLERLSGSPAGRVERRLARRYREVAHPYLNLARFLRVVGRLPGLQGPLVELLRRHPGLIDRLARPLFATAPLPQRAGRSPA